MDTSIDNPFSCQVATSQRLAMCLLASSPHGRRALGFVGGQTGKQTLVFQVEVLCETAQLTRTYFP